MMVIHVCVFCFFWVPYLGDVFVGVSIGEFSVVFV